MIVRRKPDWIAAKVGDELVMMNTVTSDYAGLSEVGARIWALIETPRPIEDICAQLVAEFDVAPEICRRDVDEFLAALGRHGAVIQEA